MVDLPDTFFVETYDKYYNRVMKFVVSKCSDIADVQDLAQEIFIEFYSLINTKGVSYIRNSEAMLIKIAKSKLFRHYSLIERLRNRTVYIKHEEYDYIEDDMIADIDVLDKVNNTLTVEEIWKVIRGKDKDVQKVLYLYYYLDMNIREIAEELKISESNVKHKIYRTLEEIRKIYKGW